MPPELHFCKQYASPKRPGTSPLPSSPILRPARHSTIYSPVDVRIDASSFLGGQWSMDIKQDLAQSDAIPPRHHAEAITQGRRAWAARET